MNFDRAFFASLDFKVMSKFDKQGFAGVSSPVPLIADNGEFLVIIDGNYAEIYDAESMVSCTGPSFQIDNISELPYQIDASKYEAKAGDEDSFSNLGL